ncbi:chlororespiratory reduction protein 7 [Roseofilum sp. BLCC_M91]|uniref:Chlororespiratory reduction protein 7 n=1 Tax=Roseofilum halophilum BLCC-M91 TaxID=3022259 RepID=A0ABT7BPP8_9CYAN|nr:chlororespiratory reduction protein 7 [Roseofilum halophilum]MDJ1181171.1 chlororespiratory reduction protein 7 [Roseofilum halophilum BLCC-M91]
MPDSVMYQSDGFVVLEANQPEQFLTEVELLDKLKACLSECQEELPRDLQKFTTLEDQAKYLMETSCELDLGPGTFLQWYVVRLEKS